jgi:predicted permease
LNGYILRPLPYPESDRLVSIYNIYPNMGLQNAGVSIPDYLDRRDQAPSLESTAIYNLVRRVLSDADRPEQVMLTRASSSLFDVLKTEPIIGRSFTEAEAAPGNDRVVVLSHAFWVNRYGGQTDIVGQDIRLDGEQYRVVGVMPEGFDFPSRIVDAWIPFAFTPAQMSDAERGQEFSRSIGRLADGATIAGLNAEIDAIVQRSRGQLPERAAFIESSGFTGRAESLHEAMTGDISLLLYLLEALVFAVLLIACANIANLQLARTVTRRQELSIRLALGASSGRLARLILSESFLLCLVGAILGIALCVPGTRVIRESMPATAGFIPDFGIDINVVLFTLAMTMAATLITGLFPLAAMRRNGLSRSVRDSVRIGGERSTNRFQSALVVFQIAASVALLVGAGLLTRSFYGLAAADPGFDRTGVWTAGVVLPAGRYETSDSISAFYGEVLEAIESLPGVTDVGFTSSLPFSGNNAQGSYSIDGYTPLSDESPPHAQQRAISEGYLPSMGIPVTQGRNFVSNESEPVAIVDELFVRRYFPAGNAIGQRISSDDPASRTWYTIVGVVPTVSHESLAIRTDKETIYWHFAQQPVAGGQFVLKTALPPEQLTPVVTQTVAAIDRDVVLADAMPIETLILRSIGQEGVAMTLTVGFAISALALAVLGIYGVMTWAVTQRVAEIGVRMALGAQQSHVMRMVLGQSGRLVVLGAFFGICLSAVIAAVLSAQIYEVSPADPLVYAVSIGSIVIAALGTSWLPARRAANVDPMKALRDA